MSLDSLIGNRRLFKFSPILNLNDFRCNAIHVKNSLKLSFPCADEEDLNSTQFFPRESTPLSCPRNMEIVKDHNDQRKENTPNDVVTEDRKSSIAFDYDVRVGNSNTCKVAADKLLKLTFKKAPPGEIETKYKERLLNPGEEVLDDVAIDYNKPIINELSMAKYKNGFISLINTWNCNLSAAEAATYNVESFGTDCIKKTPVYSTIHLFGGVVEYKDKFSHRISVKKMKAFRKNRNLKTVYSSKTKYSNFEEFSYDTRTNDLNVEIPNEIRLTVRIYMPKVKKDIRLPYNFNAGYPVIDKTFFFCGDNTLKQLKDKMLCYWDLVCVKKEEEGIPNYKDFMMYKVPSSFIFIHDTFYIDKSKPCLADITEEYREFMKKRPHLYGSTKTADMESTKLVDLNLRLGMAYVYVHMGGRCEHMFSISDIRMISFNDYHNINTYPIKVSHPLRKRSCSVCRNVGSRYIIAECESMPKTPKLMCESCYKTFNYTLSIKNSDSVVYPYVDRNLIV
uniref:snRNA-activating protein complex subunit 3 n=1 Tax=Strongyloides venezuelensis TaxID=75913 RepID=A0A0K0FIA1_STRVS